MFAETVQVTKITYLRVDLVVYFYDFFATNSNFLIPMSLQPNGVNLDISKFDFLSNIKVWNIYGLGQWVPKI